MKFRPVGHVQSSNRTGSYIGSTCVESNIKSIKLVSPIPFTTYTYANAMVTAKPNTSANTAIGCWQEHVDGKSTFDPPVPPLPPAKFTGALYLKSRSGLDNCVDYASSITSGVMDFVETVETNGDGTNGKLEVMFWAAGCPSTRKLCAYPSDSMNTSEGGVASRRTYPRFPFRCNFSVKLGPRS